MDALYLVQWIACLAALAGGVLVLWFADMVPARSDRGRWLSISIVVLMLVTLLGWWLGATGDASQHTEIDRAARLTNGVYVVALTFLVLFHTMVVPRGHLRWYARGATLLSIGFGMILAAGAQLTFPGTAWSGGAWLQVGLFVGAGVALHCALMARESSRPESHG